MIGKFIDKCIPARTPLAVCMLLLFALGFISVWNIPHTIAFRYVSAVAALCLLVLLRPSLRDIPGVLWLFGAWVVYLGAHLLFFSQDFGQAVRNYGGEWLPAAVFTLIGLGCGVLFAEHFRKTIFLLLGLAFSLPLLIHIGLSIRYGLELGAIPWGYWGINGSHGDLGYAALSALVFLLLQLIAFPGNRVIVSIVVFLIAACYVSPIIAQSRGGLVFVLAATLLVYLLHLPQRAESRPRQHKYFILGGVAILSASALMLAFAVQGNLERWLNVQNRLHFAMQSDPIRLVCDGPDSIRAALRKNGQEITPAVEQGLEGLYTDGGRLLVFRVGLRLAALHPLGIDGSKGGYRIALAKICDPAIPIANAHNGWLDTALAIGIPGALLYLALLIGYLAAGWKSLRQDPHSHAGAVGLCAFSILWIARSLVDSAQRDQMLEMQTFSLALLLGFVLASKVISAQAGRSQPESASA